MTAIEWTQKVWNPTTGCDRVSPGCDHCYALTMAKRLKGMGSAKYQNDGDPRTSGPGFGITEHPDALNLPLRWRQGQRVFVNSMSDLFHDGVTDEFISRVFAVMAATPQHTYQVLTKRHGRMRSVLSNPDFVDSVLEYVDGWFEPQRAVATLEDWAWPLRNVWLGVSVEDQKRADLRIPALLDTPAAVRWLSCEPLLGPVDLAHVGPDSLAVCDPTAIGYESGGPRGWVAGGTIGWVVVGGESGPGSRPMHPGWARQIRDECRRTRTPFFFKQWGDSAPLDQLPDDAAASWEIRNGAGYPGDTMCQVGKKATGRELDGRTWDEYPHAVAS